MRRSHLGMVFAVAIVAAACSGAADETTTTTLAGPSPTVTTTTSAPSRTPTTSTTVAAAPPVTPEAVTLGVGDPVFAELGNPGYDVQHYDLQLTYDPEMDTLHGLATIVAVATDDLDTFNVDFTRLDLLGVTVDGEEAAVARTADDVVIAPVHPIETGSTFTVAVEYGGSPQPVLDGGIAFGIGWRTTARGTYVVAEPDASNSWFPSNDHPSDKATYTFRITVPDGVTAIANGTLEETLTDLGWSTWVWEMRQPMATYLATVVTGPYDIVVDEVSTELSGVTVRNALFAGDEATPVLGKQGEMIEFFESLFGPYPFDAYGVVFVDGLRAALETQSFTVFGNVIADSPAFERVLVHELAHQWFGNLVSPATWRDTWLNEGFASYGEWLWTEFVHGRDTLDVGIDRERTRLASTEIPPPALPPDDDLFGVSVYRVGAMALHALRIEVGDEQFFSILRTYLERHAFGVASTDDFMRVAAEVTDRDLDAFFDAWLFEPGIPEFPAG